ncbi:MAG: hypothetical protein HY258_11260 [Chloroflexi bacterium]|nr:hypothetical protein [Chloroflexota bacterium]
MLFQETPPNTSGYMIAGYAVFFIVTAVYLISLYLRTRNLKRDLSALEELQRENSRPAKTKQKTARKN